LTVSAIDTDKKRPPAWKQTVADSLEAKAEAIEIAILRLEDVQDIYHDDTDRRHQIRSFIDQLKVDADNLRAQAAKARS
jgi:hypothetical protein